MGVESRVAIPHIDVLYLPELQVSRHWEEQQAPTGVIDTRT